MIYPTWIYLIFLILMTNKYQHKKPIGKHNEDDNEDMHQKPRAKSNGDDDEEMHQQPRGTTNDDADEDVPKATGKSKLSL
jgi:hypothetical protein